VRLRDEFERDPAGFTDKWRRKDAKVRQQITKAQAALPEVSVSDQALEQAARVCMALGTDGLRGELTLIRAARAVAALEGEPEVGTPHLRRVAAPALRHRLRRDPLDESGSTARVERVVQELLA
jgi:magnesium chelatase subunit I